MPIALVLEDFVMEEFAPKLALINQKGELIKEKGEKLIFSQKRSEGSVRKQLCR